jgi:hypothetical protein
MNNRQNGRRRGRGGQQARQPGAPDRGSRLDNRARGNAAQLLEKYKTLARDAQTQGDRVNTEYYLQFADHYFRVLSESRSRFEEQRRSRDDYRDEFGGEDDGADNAQRGYQQRDDGGEDGWEEGDNDRVDAPAEIQRAPQPRRQERQPYQGEGNGEPREAREPRESREPRERASAPRERGSEPREPRERTRRAPVASAASANGNGHSDTDFAAERIEADRVPPALTAEPAPVEADEQDAAAAKPRRRTRRPRADVAPAEA